MSSPYEEVYEKIEEMRNKGVEADRVIIRSDDWDDFKSEAEVTSEPDSLGDDVRVNGVPAFHHHIQSNQRIIVAVETND